MDEHTLQTYLSSEYQGEDSFLKTIIFPIFGEENYETAWQLPVLEDEELLGMATRTGIKDIIKYGTISVGHVTIDIFDVTVCDSVQMQRNRVGIQQLIRRIMNTYSSAFIIFHYKENWQLDWRFSFCQKDDKNITEAKRYTFLLGPGQSCRTAAQNFMKLLGKNGNVQRDDIVKAFDVEALSKEFFNKYKEHYDRFCAYVYNNKENPELFGEEFTQCEDKTIRDYVKKLLGRIVFLHFLQKKGWMGVPADKPWGEGDRQFMKSLFDKATDEQKANYLDEVLEPLFADALDVDRKANDDLFDCGVEGFRNVKIPYLNGGLFERDKMDEPKSTFSRNLFADLFNFLYQYNFTIDENDPNDAEVGVDPEMLGRIFENLLEDNKDKGAFYTPREIVQYMCRESLIAYLQTDVEDEAVKSQIRAFVATYNADLLSADLTASIDQKLKDVKICDPAIGSGAFPMGLMKELYLCRSVIEGFDGSKAAEIKKHIIQQNIYGVDIEKGAVDIARLRFWLSLILDEETPHALPNLDFKIMQGNSLLEQYEGIDLSGMTLDEQKKRRAKAGDAYQTSLAFDEKLALENIQKAIKLYYLTDSHDAKLSLRKIIDDNVKNYILNLKGCTPDIQRKLETLPIPNDQFFLWHIYFKEVLDKGGFDVVIGNPPYIDSETMVKVMPKERELYSKKFACASGNWDMFIVFIEFGISLLNEKGIFSNIIPNKLIAAKYGVSLRKHLSDKHVIEIRDYSRIDVFEDAAVYPITIVLRNYDKKDNTLFTIMDNRVEIKQSNKANSCDLARNDYWDPFFRDTSIFNLITKINSFNPLKDLPVEVSGAATVADAYEIKNIVQDSNSGLGFKLVNSGTIDPYLSYWGIKPCRYIKGSYTYPIVPAEDLKNYSEVRYKQASSPKIIVASMTTRYEAFLDVKGEYIAGKSTSIILGETKYLYKLTAIINSKLASYWLNIVFNSLKMSGGAINIGRNELQILPIPDRDVDFTLLVNKIMECKSSSSLNSPTAEEREIDRLVYDLYGLTEDEIAIVEGTSI